MPYLKNALLAQLNIRSAERIQRHLRIADLHYGQVLAETHDRVQQVYFPHSGIVSCVVALQDGSSIETGMIGWDGEYGAGQALDDKLSLNRVMIQAAGTASVIDSDRLREVADAVPAFRKLLVGYEQFFLAQVQQTAACNASHDIEARTCRWLLRMYDLAGPDLPLTQEFLAQMMGVMRTSVSGIAAELQRAGLISYSRGRLHIRNIDLVLERACECHDAVKSHYDMIFGRHVV
jgi:CRP-like cAMP-binding protein